MLREPGPLCRENIVELWDSMPRQRKQGPTGGRTFLTGASHRSSLAPLHNVYGTPCVTQALTSFVRRLHTGIPFSCITIREGATKGLHRDSQNACVPSIIIGLTDHERGDLWIEHPEGSISREHEGRTVRGNTYPLLPSPVVFTSNLLLHGPMPWTGRRRLILIAFTPRNVKTFSTELKSLLLSQGFTLPTPAQMNRFKRNIVRPGITQLSIPAALTRARVASLEYPSQLEIHERQPPQEISSSEEEPQAQGIRHTGLLRPQSPGFISRLLVEDQRDLENEVPWMESTQELSQSSYMTATQPSRAPAANQARDEGTDRLRRLERLDAAQIEEDPTPRPPPPKRAKTMPAAFPSRHFPSHPL